jgi:predicted ATPase
MVEKIHIENFKSIRSLDLELGRVNVFIGENGSGKTNVLEAIGIGGAAYQNSDLHSDNIVARGGRFQDWESYKSGFNLVQNDPKIEISFNTNDSVNFIIKLIENDKYKIIIEHSFGDKNANLMADLFLSDIKNIITPEKVEKYSNKEQQGVNEDDLYNKIQKILSNSILKNSTVDFFKNHNFKNGDELQRYLAESNGVIDFAIFCPENTFLRRTDEEGHLRPIGIKGEGLLNYLSDLLEREPEIFDKIKDKLQVFGWFEDFNLKTNFLTGGRSMELKDRFLAEGIKTIGLKNANEGFLFVLFYLTLFSSKNTPKFFAIDNFDNALNPKLCKELLIILTQIAKENDKQVLITTHNPAVLDGLNLNDEEQRLFVVSRSGKTGETKISRFLKKTTPFGETPVRLSEKFMNGSLGGLPKNF